MTKILKIFLFLLLAAWPLTGLATGIQVSPARLDTEANFQKQSSQTLTVINPTADVQVFEVYPDGFQDMISANPSSFTLESGGRKIVMVIVDLQKSQNKNQDQKFSTTLSVVGRPLAESRLSVGTGVKIPLTITLSNQATSAKSLPLIFWPAVLLIFVLILKALVSSKKAI